MGNSAALILLLLGAAAARAQDAFAPRSSFAVCAPPSGQFSCEYPRDGWKETADRDALGEVVHILGPENPSGTFRAGYMIRWLDQDSAGFVDAKQELDRLRRSDKLTVRRATAVRPMRVAGLLARTFEVVETRALPLNRLPAEEAEIHRYVAVIPSGSGCYLVTLATTRDVYLDYREEWMRFLRSFQPLGR